MSEILKCPFPYFGGKSKIAPEIWERFGRVPNYIEPFFGSGAVLLARPEPFDGVETVNDMDSFICNFWRAVKTAPDKVAEFADNPVNENDQHARHFWLTGRKETLAPKLEGDPEWFDAKIAGWWCWLMGCWIGGGICSGEGPWTVQVIDGVRQLIHLSDAGTGVNRQLIHLSGAGRGVNRKRIHLSDAGRGETASESILPVNIGIYDWMRQLAKRLSRVRVCCGDWTRVCGGKSGDALDHFFAGGNQCAIFLDPPYSAEAGRDNKIYRKEDLTVAHDVRDWAVAHGNDPRLRIALAGYDGEHEMPEDWTVQKWKAGGAYANLSDDEDSAGKQNCKRERIWFSPHCLPPEQATLL